MTECIWKYPLPTDRAEFTIYMPFKGYEFGRPSGEPMPIAFRHLAVQHGKPCLWASVLPNDPVTPFRFKWVGTGDMVPEDAANYIGTVQLLGGDLVLHLVSCRNHPPP